MTTPTQDPRTGPIESLYLWGARCVGVVLLIGIVMQIAPLIVGAPDGIIGDAGRIWPDVAMICLAMLPVVSLAVAGAAWIARDRRDLAGWMAVTTALFLSAMWVLK